MMALLFGQPIIVEDFDGDNIRLLMDTENDHNFETVIIDGQTWAVTSPSHREISELEPASDEKALAEQQEGAPADAADDPETIAEDENIVPAGNRGESPVSAEAEQPPEGDTDAGNETSEAVYEPGEAADEPGEAADEPEFDALRALTSLLVGGAIEGTSQLTTRLQQYQEDLRREAAINAEADGEVAVGDEDELVRLRYALVGLIFDVQTTFRRNVSLWAKLADRSAGITNHITEPVTNSFLFGPARRRYQRLVRRGEERLARWIADGRIDEPPSRALATRTYEEIVDEFIHRLAENPELQALITEQSIGVASDMRDEVRERTVTADNVVEGLLRRVLRRTPRVELPEPPPEVQRWAGLTLEEAKALQLADEAKDGNS